MEHHTINDQCIIIVKTYYKYIERLIETVYNFGLVVDVTSQAYHRNVRPAARVEISATENRITWIRHGS